MKERGAKATRLTERFTSELLDFNYSTHAVEVFITCSRSFSFKKGREMLDGLVFGPVACNK